MSQGAEIQMLIKEVRDFARERDWEKFHTPKNLAMAIVGEAGELAAEFQWLSENESLSSELPKEKLEAVELEIADVAIYLLRMVDVLELDLSSVIRKKLAINQIRF
jgi:NTP pyrophosphatase (non-canonical NTP hydrolase)